MSRCFAALGIVLLNASMALAGVAPPVVRIIPVGKRLANVELEAHPTGGFYFAGTYEAPAVRDCYLARYDAMGTRLWQTDLAKGTSLDDGSVIGIMQMPMLAVDAAGDCFLTGTDFWYDSNDVHVVKTASDGQRQWIRRLGQPAYDCPAGIAPDELGGCWLASSVNCATNGHPPQGESWWDLRHYGPDGDLLTVIRHDPPAGQWPKWFSRDSSLALHDDGRLVFAQWDMAHLPWIGGTTVQGLDPKLVGFDQDHEVDWTVPVSPYRPEVPETAAAAPGGATVVATGQALLCFESDGGIRWTFPELTGYENLTFEDMDVTASGEVYFLGQYYDKDGDQNTVFDYLVGCADMDGQVQWVRELDNVDRWMWSVRADEVGNVYVGCRTADTRELVVMVLPEPAALGLLACGFAVVRRRPTRRPAS